MYDYLVEATHVAFLESALGPQAVEPCEYNLYVLLLRITSSYKTDCRSCSGDTSVMAFVGFSAMVETIGTSAYTGAAQLISNKVYLHFRLVLRQH
jgi:hypothetical protein